ncbi:MAG: hypothetical protein ACKOA9_13140, partial [Actinomycetota bacterium]
MTRSAKRTVGVLVALVALLVTAAVVAAVGLGTDGATAITVGDQRLSKQAFNDDLRAWAEFPLAQARSTDGAVSADAGAAIATQTVYRMLANRYLERVGERVTDADRATVLDAVSGNPDFAQAPEPFRDRFVVQQSTLAALTRLVGTDEQGTTEVRVLRREAKRVDVTVAPAYGRFDPV